MFYFYGHLFVYCTFLFSPTKQKRELGEELNKYGTRGGVNHLAKKPNIKKIGSVVIRNSRHRHFRNASDRSPLPPIANSREGVEAHWEFRYE